MKRYQSANKIIEERREAGRANRRNPYDTICHHNRNAQGWGALSRFHRLCY
jgi:hypothetical protein